MAAWRKFRQGDLEKGRHGDRDTDSLESQTKDTGKKKMDRTLTGKVALVTGASLKIDGGFGA
jgi:hypothetical protein